MNKEILYDRNVVQPGDGLRIPRNGPYSHWAVYEGDGEVIHLANVDKLGSQRNNSSVLTGHGTAEIRRDKLKDVVGDSACYINNTYDEQKISFSQDKILKRARKSVGETGNYSIFSHNCESFVSWARNGDSHTFQGDVLTIVVGVALAGAAAYGAYKMYRWWFPGSEEKKQKH